MIYSTIEFKLLNQFLIFEQVCEFFSKKKVLALLLKIKLTYEIYTQFIRNEFF